ncbi:MAG TPA: tetratricopeptide repeat protein, partial [Candidatus Polarisedimenticolia bacterium]|nr:tetratricopeptide repeat protein [Candidatus Polarisedimenticolia bacterium]
MMPRDPRAYLQRAEEHRRHGRLKEAIALSIEALGKHPGLDAVRVTLGRAYLENAQPEEARTTLHEVFQRQPSHHLAGKFLVESQRLLGDLAGAAATCRTLLEHYPRDREIEPLLAEIVRAESSPETADAPPPPALKAAAPTALEDEADPQPDYLPEDLGSPRSPAPMAGTHPEAPAHVAAATAAATTPAQPAAPAPAVAPGLSTAQIDRAIEAARPPSPTPASAPKVAAAMPSPAVTPAPMAAKPAAPAPMATKPVLSEPAAPPRPIATAPMAPSPVVSMPTPAPPAPTARMETAASAPAAPAAAPAPAASAAGAGAAKRDALETNTLAELYVKQGLPDRAIEVYRSMLRVEPGNLAARHRLA